MEKMRQNEKETKRCVSSRTVERVHGWDKDHPYKTLVEGLRRKKIIDQKTMSIKMKRASIISTKSMNRKKIRFH